jgi:prophage DNA circulation protein
MEEMKLIPLDERGRQAGATQIRHWIESEWHQWRDAMNAELSTKTETELLNRKIEIIKEQLNQTRVVRNQAYAAIKDGKFDTSAAAVSAFFRASQEERGLMQIEKVIEDLAKLQTNDLQTQFRELAERAGATVIDAEEKIEDQEAGENNDTE